MKKHVKVYHIFDDEKILRYLGIVKLTKEKLEQIGTHKDLSTFTVIEDREYVVLSVIINIIHAEIQRRDDIIVITESMFLDVYDMITNIDFEKFKVEVLYENDEIVNVIYSKKLKKKCIAIAKTIFNKALKERIKDIEELLAINEVLKD